MNPDKRKRTERTRVRKIFFLSSVFTAEDQMNHILDLSENTDDSEELKDMAKRFSRTFRAAITAVLVFGAVAAANPSERLLDAILQVESSGGRYTVGDNGKAVGPYQIHMVYVDDVNRIAKTSYTYTDRKDEAKSRQMVRAYLTHYGKGKSQLDLARIHNGGPKGHTKKATLPYAEKIKKYLEK